MTTRTTRSAAKRRPTVKFADFETKSLKRQKVDSNDKLKLEKRTSERLREQASEADLNVKL